MSRGEQLKVLLDSNNPLATVLRLYQVDHVKSFPSSATASHNLQQNVLVLVNGACKNNRGFRLTRIHVALKDYHLFSKVSPKVLSVIASVPSISLVRRVASGNWLQVLEKMNEPEKLVYILCKLNDGGVRSQLSSIFWHLRQSEDSHLYDQFIETIDKVAHYVYAGDLARSIRDVANWVKSKDIQTNKIILLNNDFSFYFIYRLMWAKPRLLKQLTEKHIAPIAKAVAKFSDLFLNDLCSQLFADLLPDRRCLLDLLLSRFHLFSFIFFSENEYQQSIFDLKYAIFSMLRSGMNFELLLDQLDHPAIDNEVLQAVLFLKEQDYVTGISSMLLVKKFDQSIPSVSYDAAMQAIDTLSAMGIHLEESNRRIQYKAKFDNLMPLQKISKFLMFGIPVGQMLFAIYSQRKQEKEQDHQLLVSHQINFGVATTWSAAEIIYPAMIKLRESMLYNRNSSTNNHRLGHLPLEVIARILLFYAESVRDLVSTRKISISFYEAHNLLLQNPIAFLSGDREDSFRYENPIYTLLSKAKAHTYQPTESIADLKQRLLNLSRQYRQDLVSDCYVSLKHYCSFGLYMISGAFSGALPAGLVSFYFFVPMSVRAEGLIASFSAKNEKLDTIIFSLVLGAALGMVTGYDAFKNPAPVKKSSITHDEYKRTRGMLFSARFHKYLMASGLRDGGNIEVPVSRQLTA